VGVLAHCCPRRLLREARGTRVRGLRPRAPPFDSDDSWQIGSDVQTQLSRSKRFLPRPAQEKLVEAQQEIVDYLDHEIDKRRDAATPGEWEKLYESLMTKTRPAIDELLVDLIRDLKIGRTQER
jgi:hypothetical protein